MNILNTIKRIIIGSVLCLALLPVQAAKHADGLDAARQGDYSLALKFWRVKAGQGDAQAQFNLALMYHGGLGVMMDEAQALLWYKKAALSGYPWAQEYMAIAYQEGWFGLKQDRKQSLRWFKQLNKNNYF